ncbi:MAG: AAA family ATPase [Acidimicrobiia bacterium]|nr:AAA family ATPase [Acidimicrobiia bacterium]MBT8193052.1 AAA family ATPase [Acidimicrobiia bacterium]NNF87664.1 AAA family ATPase [Acidimicrobiia bacterium]NNL14622.1 AAA family ATPase [Acidimicrobiia bacterium]NNL97578.1 AAA family ATPase [Acidimicrobiia bacterium]
MIDELRVSNLGIIEDATIEPGPGLVVVTGETGAGKTMLLGALRLLLGGPARTEAIGPHADEARVEGRFVTGPDDEMVVARRLTPSGRSRAYIDGDMVPVKELTARMEGAVEVVGQHDHLLITRPGSVRVLLDATLDAEGQDARRAYHSAWSGLKDVEAAQAALGGDRRALERELDLVAHQAQEIAAAGFESGEEGALATRATRLRHAEELTTELAAAYDSLDQAEGVDDAAGRIRRAASLDPSLEQLLEQAADMQALVVELRTALRGAVDALNHDPGELEELEARIAVLNDLKRKYGSDLTEVLAFGDRAAARVEQIGGLLARADHLESELTDARESVAAAGERLRAGRLRAAKEISESAVDHLRQLGFSAPVVELAVSPAEPTASGIDAIELLFSSDESITPAPASRVASGGELSRLVLSLRLAGGVGEAAVIAFDEIDAGIGGATALAMGEKLNGLADGRQVLCVTHLPQVAAFATTHLVVDREGATARVRPVVGDERVAEITRMLSGLPESERGQDHALELLALGGR